MRHIIQDTLMKIIFVTFFNLEVSIRIYCISVFSVLHVSRGYDSSIQNSNNDEPEDQ